MMDSYDLRSDMTLIPECDRQHPAWSAFVEAMRGKCYGEDPLNDAWHWFQQGYDSGYSRGHESGLECGIERGYNLGRYEGCRE